MTRNSETYEDTITLDTPEGYCECPAVFDVESETYPAEPYSWGAWRGMETEARAELVSAQFGGLTLTRTQVEAITGADHLARQERMAADSFVEHMEDAA